MSLFKQLFISFCLVLVANFVGSFWLGLEQSREQQVSQLRAHAQDAATALGVSLSAHVNDRTMTELMVNSIFDSGYFLTIKVIDTLTEKPLLERQGAPLTAQAPQWFIDLVNLQPAIGHAYVSNGWRQAARIEVVSHPLFAIDRLWQSMLASLIWLAVSTLVCLMILAWLLKRQLKPLNYLVEQANAISRREFLSLEKLPNAPEFRRVVGAMNQMVEKLKALFAQEAARTEALHHQAYTDALTGLANRQHFEIQLKERLSGEDTLSTGHLIVIKVQNLTALNESLGGAKTNQLLMHTAQMITQLAPHLPAARIRGAEFAILGLGLKEEDALSLAKQLRLHLDTGLNSKIGISHFSRAIDPASLFQHIDHALSHANTANDFIAVSNANIEKNLPEASWQQRLSEAFTHKRFHLYWQPVIKATDKSIWHYKVLARLMRETGEVIPACDFLPWLERFNQLAALDLYVLESALVHIRQHAQPLAVSISKDVLSDPQHQAALYRLLDEHQACANLLTIEIAENQLPDANQFSALAQKLNQLGYHLAIEHFDGRFSIIENLAGLGLSHLKIAATYIRSIDQDKEKQQFVSAMVRASASLDIDVVAEQVESEQEWQTLIGLGVTAAQGRLFANPAPVAT